MHRGYMTQEGSLGTCSDNYEQCGQTKTENGKMAGILVFVLK